MISFRREYLYEVQIEIDELLQLHYEELTRNKDRVKLAPMWEEYATLERMNRFIVFAARDGSRLVGYSAFFLTHHLHYQELMTAMNDVLFLHPECRQGTTGLRLIKFCEVELKKLGAQKVCWHAKLDTALIPILKRMGYQVEEISLAKFI
jgi:hypothetical protein